jgi:hypothetical protein
MILSRSVCQLIKNHQQEGFSGKEPVYTVFPLSKPGNMDFTYVSEIGYDEFGARSRMRAGEHVLPAYVTRRAPDERK